MSAKKSAGPSWGDGFVQEIPEGNYIPVNAMEPGTAKPTLLLHSCCGPCSTAVLERLVPEYSITVFFYNPNITDEEEYRRRKEAQLEVIRRFNENPDLPCHVDFTEGPYDRQRFFEAAAGFSNEPEGGIRCANCYFMRLDKTAGTAKMLGFDLFATTLTVSPHKDSDLVGNLGRRLAVIYGVGFLDRNFKKNNGYRRSCELSKAFGLYRQNFCGCVYSMPPEERNPQDE